MKEILEQIELQYIHEYYEEYKTLEKAADKLGVNVKTLSRRKRYLEQKYLLDEQELNKENLKYKKSLKNEKRERKINLIIEKKIGGIDGEN